MLSVKKCIFYSFVVLLPLLANYKIMASEAESSASHMEKSAESNVSHCHEEAFTASYNRIGVVFPEGSGKHPCSVCDCKDFKIHPTVTTECIWCGHTCVQHGCKKGKK
ncbi:MAG: hypothetical protein E3K37_08580 [Candidatus Kuenenia sp.]|nr:hypothetical protein [Candidatus Kuenenia hertensis]